MREHPRASRGLLSGLFTWRDAQKLDEEFEHCICRNCVWNLGAAICEMWPHSYPTFTTSAHTFNAILQPGYNAPLSNSEHALHLLLNTLATVEEKVVLNFDHASAISYRSAASLNIFVLDATATFVHD